MDGVRSRDEYCHPFNKAGMFETGVQDGVFKSSDNEENFQDPSFKSDQDDIHNRTFDSGIGESLYGGYDMTADYDPRRDQEDIHSGLGKDISADFDWKENVLDGDLFNTTFDSGLGQSDCGASDWRDDAVSDCPETVCKDPGLLDSNFYRPQDPGGGKTKEQDLGFVSGGSQNEESSKKKCFAPRPKPKRKGWKKLFKNPYSRPHGSYKTSKTHSDHEFDPVISEVTGDCQPMSHSPILERHLHTIPEVWEETQNDVDVDVDVDCQTSEEEEEAPQSQPWDEFRDETSIPNMLHNLLIERAKKKRDQEGSFDTTSTDSEVSSSDGSDSEASIPEPEMMEDELPKNPQDCSRFFDDETRIIFLHKDIDCCCHESERISICEDEVCFTFHFTKSGLYFVENGGQITMSLRDQSYDKYMMKEQLRRIKRGQLLKWDAVKRNHTLNTGKTIIIKI